MLKYKDNPRELMQALDRFLSVYFSDRQVKYKPELDRIAAWNIPQPLKDIYSFIGKYSNKHRAFGEQNTLIFNSGKRDCSKKLYFLGEHSGVWSGLTEFAGEDPPVWIEIYGYGEDFPKLNLVNNSLSQFLVTFCLQEAFLNSRYRQQIGEFRSKIDTKEILAVAQEQGYETSLLWQGSYVGHIFYNRISNINNFYVVENAILVWGNACATNYKNADRLITSIQSEFK